MQKSILITGASRGIGAATALLAAEHGYRVCINYRSHDKEALQLVDAIQRAGGDAFACKADIGREAEILDMFAQIDLRFGRLDALVNNAGIVDKQARLTDISLERIHNLFSINVFGAMLCAREAVKRMSVLHGGSGGNIVNISSGAVKSGAPNEYIDYAATKGALDVFTIGLAKEVAKEGIRVNGIRPGFIDTEIHLQTGIPNRLALKSPQIPMGRAGNPQEIAQAVLWLLSDQASYMTGANLDITGGV
jgi:NAD(P)-dependent dehydrogenase (short-subunit alcohol dehydrogenase family)